MIIAVGADHGGFKAKTALLETLTRAGHILLDKGTRSEAPCDYPDMAHRVARAVAEGRAERGVLVCGTGIGMSIAANKTRGIRAAVAWTNATARLAARHNGANVLCLGGRLLSPERIVRLVTLWLQTPFEGGRHARRIEKISQLEGGKI